MTGFNKVMRFCNTLQDYESAKNQGTITDDLFVVILQDKLAKFKGQTFDWSQNADLTALATKGELEALAEEIASNERVWAEALNDLNERINEIGTGGGGGGGTSDIVVDAALSTTSTNAIQNKAVANALNEKADASALASKQDTLVSGTNIKTVQGQSILGSGDISISVPTVDAALSSTSTNAVQNKVVKAAIDELQNKDTQIDAKQAELSEKIGVFHINVEVPAYDSTTWLLGSPKSPIKMERGIVFTDLTEAEKIACAIVKVDGSIIYITPSTEPRYAAADEIGFAIYRRASDVATSANVKLLTSAAFADYMHSEDINRLDSKTDIIETELNSLRLKSLGEVYLSRDVGYILTSQAVVSLTPRYTASDYQYGVFNVNAGDSFTFTGSGGGDARLWCFADKNLNVLSVAEAYASASNPITITAPTNAAYCIINRIRKDDPVIVHSKDTEQFHVLLNSSEKFKELYDEIVMEDGKLWETIGLEGDTISGKQSQLSTYECAKIPCKEGDRFIVNSIGSNNSAKPFAFIDGNNKILYTTGAIADRFSGLISAPSDSEYLIINNKDKTLKSHRVKNGATIVEGWANTMELNSLNFGFDKISSLMTAGFFNSFCINVGNTSNYACAILTAKAKYEGSAPTIQIQIGDIYLSTPYVLGAKGYFSIKQWRIPPRVCNQYIRINVNVPANCQLEIEEFSCNSCSDKTSWNGGVRLDSHLGFQSLAPENTIVAFELAAMCNYPSCIVNPIMSADGTFYCYHEGDETLTLDGISYKALTAEEFSALTDAQVAQYKVGGFRTQRNYYAEPIPTLEQFFELCARTGMHPMFSTHPVPTDEGWQIIKALLVKYNLLHKMTIKAFGVNVLEDAYRHLGDIEGYIYDVDGYNAAAYCAEMDNSTISAFKGRKGIEYPVSDMTRETAETTIAQGYFPSAWGLGNIKGEKYYELMSWGVMEFADDNNSSSGLNW